MSYMEWIVSKEKIFDFKSSHTEAQFSKFLGIQKISVSWIKLSPNQKFVISQSVSQTEQCVFVVSGRPKFMMNEVSQQLEPNHVIGIISGFGLNQVIQNKTNTDVEFVLIGNLKPSQDHEYEQIQEQKSEIFPRIIRINEIERSGSFSYLGDNETFSQGIRLSDHFEFKSLGVWHEIMKSGKRSSWPHAHKIEEEIAVILKGEAKVWLNGFVHDLKPGDCVYFKPGTNISHVLMNESSSDIEFLGIGQAEDLAPHEKLIYSFHNNRNQECHEKGLLWENPPQIKLGPHLALPQVKNCRVEVLSSEQNFLDLLKPLLNKKEAEYGLLLGNVIQQLSVNPQQYKNKYIAIYENEILVGGCFLGEKYLILSQIPGPLLNPLAEYFFRNHFEIPGIVGPSATCETFALIWSELSQLSYTLNMSQKIYELKAVTMPQSIRGQLLVADDSHLEILTQWVYEFMKESLPFEQTTLEKSKEYVLRKLKNKEAFVLQNSSGEIVSMNYVARPTDHGISVSLVYTPKLHRKKGYASSLVAFTSDLMLQRGYEFCVLYTDSQNPTSNKIYQDVGYREVATSRHFVFSK